MKIPIFVSCPTILNPNQEKARNVILKQLKDLQFEPRAIGREDYPTELPLREVISISRHCSGGVILGFSQFETQNGIWKKGTIEEKKESKSNMEPIVFPSPWNNLEAGILFSQQIPLLIFREPNINGGVFDPGVTDVFIHLMPTYPIKNIKKESLKQVFLKWSAMVRRHYYGDILK